MARIIDFVEASHALMFKKIEKTGPYGRSPGQDLIHYSRGLRITNNFIFISSGPMLRRPSGQYLPIAEGCKIIPISEYIAAGSPENVR